MPEISDERKPASEDTSTGAPGSPVAPGTDAQAPETPGSQPEGASLAAEASPEKRRRRRRRHGPPPTGADQPAASAPSEAAAETAVATVETSAPAQPGETPAPQ